MKIALLGSRSPAGEAGRQLELLARALPDHGCSVAVFRAGADPVGEALLLRDLFGRAAEFDLVHNHLGARALVHQGRAAAPVVTTLHGAPLADELELCRAFAEQAWFVADGEEARACGLDCLALVPRAGDSDDEGARVARDYLGVYARVLEAARARRVDRLHDRRPWGEYTVLHDAPDHKVKRIDVLPGKRLSYQSHERRSEHWIVVAGQARVTLDGRTVELAPGASVDIPAGTRHRVENPGAGLLTFVEVQHGSYFGEDDIVRYEDDFGRTG